MREIKKIIVHCSASETGDVKIIREWHKARNFKDIGYHYVIRRDGEIEIGRMLSEIGAHCQGENQDSIGICMIGNKNFEKCQFETLNKLVDELRRWFGRIPVHGHRDFNKHKTCPNVEVKDIIVRA